MCSETLYTRGVFLNFASNTATAFVAGNQTYNFTCGAVQCIRPYATAVGAVCVSFSKHWYASLLLSFVIKQGQSYAYARFTMPFLFFKGLLASSYSFMHAILLNVLMIQHMQQFIAPFVD